MLPALLACSSTSFVHHASLIVRAPRWTSPPIVCAETAEPTFARAPDFFQQQGKVSQREIVNVLGRWESYREWDTIGRAGELDAMLDGKKEYVPPDDKNAPAVDTAATPRRRDFCRNKNLVQRYWLKENVGLLRFRLDKLAYSVGASPRELNVEPLNPLAVDVVFDALAESQSGIVDKKDCDAQRATFAGEDGSFDAVAFGDALGRARRNILLSYATYPGIPNLIFLITAIKLDGFTLARENAEQILDVIQANWEQNGIFSVLLPALPFSIVAYGAANPPKSNKAAGEAAAKDRVFMETRLKTKQKTDDKMPTPTLSN